MKAALFCLLALLPVIAAAQETRRHEVGISIGCGPNDADMKVNDMLDLLSDKYQMEEDFTQGDLLSLVHATISVDYLHHLSHRWAAGGLFGWAFAAGKFIGNKPLYVPSQESVTGTDVLPAFDTGRLFSHTFYVLPFARYSWYVTDNQVFRCYSKVALGYMRQVNDFRPTYARDPQQIGDLKPIYRVDQRVTFQVTIGGIEFGNQRIRLYSELGYGCQGMFNVGMKLAL